MAGKRSGLTRGVVGMLGGRKALKVLPRSGMQMHSLILAGLSYAALEVVMDKLDLDRREICRALAVSPRTLSRRKDERRLQPDESDRLYRVARIAARAAEVLGNTRKAARWLRRANRSLGGETPLNMLRTDLGARQVERALGRIEHGVIG